MPVLLTEHRLLCIGEDKVLHKHDYSPPFKGLGDALEKLLRPAVGFDHPIDVVRDPDLDLDQKRAILASWASDASAIEGEPTLRWLIGSEAPVPLREVLEARQALDRLAASLNVGERYAGLSPDKTTA